MKWSIFYRYLSICICCLLFCSLACCKDGCKGKKDNQTDQQTDLPENPDDSKIRAKLPDNFPSNIPLYPNIRLIGCNVNEDGIIRGAFFETTDSIDRVSNFYQIHLKQDGWKNIRYTKMKDSNMMEFLKDGIIFVLQVKKTDKGSKICILTYKEYKKT